MLAAIKTFKLIQIEQNIPWKFLRSVKAPSLRVSSQDGTEFVLNDDWRFGEADPDPPNAPSPKHSKDSAPAMFQYKS